MTIKEKVLQALKTKYKNFGLTEKTLEAMADTLAAQLKEESEQSEIDDKVNGAENFLKAFQSEADKRVTDAVSKAKGTTTNQNQNDQEPAAPAGEPSEIAKAVAAAMAPFMQEIASIKGEKLADTRKQKLEKALAGVPDNLKTRALKDFQRMSFEKEEDFDGYLAEVETDYASYKTNDDPFNNLGAPPQSAGETKAVSPMMKTYLETNKPKENARS